MQLLATLCGRSLLFQWFQVLLSISYKLMDIKEGKNKQQFAQNG